MSWLSLLIHSALNGLTGKGPITHPDQTPLHTALDQVNSAANATAAVLGSAAKSTVDAYVETKVGPVGTEVVDAALSALIAEATSRLSPAAPGTPPLILSPGA